MAILGGSGVRRRVVGGAVCIQPAPWKVSREKVIGILAKAKNEGKIWKSPVLATVGSTPVLFG